MADGNNVCNLCQHGVTIFGDTNLHIHVNQESPPVTPPVPHDEEFAVGLCVDELSKKLRSELRKCANDQDLPMVHPILLDVDFYRGGNDVTAFRPSNHPDANCFHYHTNLQIEEVLQKAKETRFCALIGPPGCGKTTISKRLALLNSGIKCFHYKLMEMNYRDQRFTLKKLLIDFVYRELSETQQTAAFNWIRNNQQKCAFIFDGYDQATWSLKETDLINCDYDTPLLIQQHMANLCHGKFLPKATVIFTSRPHSMIPIHEALRPKLTILVHELEEEGMRVLFSAWAGENSDEIWNNFIQSSPLLLKLCRTPGLLHFIILATINRREGLRGLQTITEIYSTLFKNISHSDLSRGAGLAKMCEIGRLAYHATQREAVMMDVEDLEREELTEKEVQDYIIALPGYHGPGQRLLAGDHLYFFVHQTWQEYFTARYICCFLSHDQFDIVVDVLVSDSRWTMVRRFVCGILLQESTPDQEKTEKFHRKLMEHYRDVTEDEFLELLIDLQEANERFLTSFVDVFPVVVGFRWVTFDSRNSFALSRILEQVDKPLKKIDLIECVVTDVLREICMGIGAMKYRLTHLCLRGCVMGDHGIAALSHCVHNVDEMDLRLCNITNIRPMTQAVANIIQPMRQLSFSGNEIGNEGADSLASCVHNISELEVREGGITIIDSLADSILEHNHLLKLLDLSFNPFGDEGVPALIRCLSNIERVRLYKCPISAQSKQQIRAKLRELNLPERRVIW